MQRPQQQQTLQHSLCQAISRPHEECRQGNEPQLCPRALQNYKIVSISICSAPHPVCLNQRAAQSSNIKKKKKNSCFGGFIGGRGPTPSLIALLAPCGMLGTLIGKEISLWRWEWRSWHTAGSHKKAAQLRLQFIPNFTHLWVEKERKQTWPHSS